MCGTWEGCAPATELYTGIHHLHMTLVVVNAVLVEVVMYTHATDCKLKQYVWYLGRVCTSYRAVYRYSSLTHDLVVAVNAALVEVEVMYN